MHYTDEDISRFLDGELSASDMQAVRDEIASNDSFATRVEAMAITDNAVRTAYQAIDAEPLPATIAALLGDNPNSQNNIKNNIKSNIKSNIVTLPAARRWNRFIPGAVAACLTLGLGYTLMQSNHTLDTPEPTSVAWQQPLNTTPSGQPVTLTNGDTLRVNLTFNTSDGRTCRQFSLSNRSSASDNIACRQTDDHTAPWQTLAHLPRPATENTIEKQHYQTASRNAAVDSEIDKIIVGPVLSVQQEQTLIQRWQSTKTQ
jgi:hypothetical protein